jgi:hypothetical protein
MLERMQERLRNGRVLIPAESAGRVRRTLKAREADAHLGDDAADDGAEALVEAERRLSRDNLLARRKEAEWRELGWGRKMRSTSAGCPALRAAYVVGTDPLELARARELHPNLERAQPVGRGHQTGKGRNTSRQAQADLDRVCEKRSGAKISGAAG